MLRIFFLAVAPGRTRSALLGRMLAHLGRMADTEGRYTWLDTVFLPDEDAVLEAQGFLRLRRLKVEGGGPALSVLVRPPHSREGGSK